MTEEWMGADTMFTFHLQQLAEFLLEHPEIDTRMVNFNATGTTFHLNTYAPDDWREIAEMIVGLFGVAVIDQHHGSWLAARIADSRFGRISMYLPTTSDPTTSKVDLTGIAVIG